MPIIARIDRRSDGFKVDISLGGKLFATQTPALWGMDDPLSSRSFGLDPHWGKANKGVPC